MKLQIRSESGKVIQAALKAKYPEADFKVQYDDDKAYYTIIMSRRTSNGNTLGIAVQITYEMIEKRSEIMKHEIEYGIRKLEEAVRKEESKLNNPSSRMFGTKWIH